jgi:hypothetical protein
MEGRVGASRFGPGWRVFKYETAARMHWVQNGDVRVDVEGGRMAGARMPGFGRNEMADFFEEIFGGEPWFIPSSMGDEVRLLGLPEVDALHPFARGAQRYYHYEIIDSLRIAHSDRTVRIVSVQVEPRSDLVSGVTEEEVWEGRARPNPNAARRRRILATTLDPYARSLISGRIWIDADSLDVVRLTCAFLGEGIWNYEDDAPELVALEADIEYGLHLNRFWLPHRQVLSAHWIFKFLPGADLVGTGITTFSEHDVHIAESEIVYAHDAPAFRMPNTVTLLEGERGTSRRLGTWNCPDAWEFEGDPNDPDCGTQPTTSAGVTTDGKRWEVNLPTLDSLRSYDFEGEWNESMDLAGSEFLDNAISEIAKYGTSSPAAQAFARDPGGLDWKHMYNAVGFNRVQGISVGGGYQWDLWPAYTTLHLNARYGVHDRHMLASATWRRDAPAGRFESSVYRSVRDVEPWTRGTGVGNSLKALVLGHDDADYYFAPAGLGISFHGYGGWFRDGRVSVEAERQEALSNITSSPFSGGFQPNPVIVNGDFIRGALSKSWHPGFSGTTEITLGAEGLFSRDSLSGRFWGGAHLPYGSATAISSLRLRGGIVIGSELPQMRYRVGGPKTVRGYEYGEQSGRTIWSAQGDLEWIVSQWWSPVLFADIGGVDFSDTPLVGLGVGVSLFSGWMRFDLARGMTMGGGFRFDVLLGIPTS